MNTLLAPILVAVLALLGCIEAFPNGAPVRQMMAAMDSTCTTGNLRPGHEVNGSLIMPQFSNPPFQLRVLNADRPYTPGTPVAIKLSSRQRGVTFKGFYITGDGEDAKAGFKGQFRPAPRSSAKRGQFCVDGITHLNAQPKREITVFWDPPANYTHGQVQFKATVVQDFRKFWTGILSNAIQATDTLDTQSVKTQKDMQRMMGMNFGNNGGGAGGALNFGDLMKKMQNMMGAGGANNQGGGDAGAGAAFPFHGGMMGPLAPHGGHGNFNQQRGGFQSFPSMGGMQG